MKPDSPILLIEDNPDDEKMTLRALRRGTPDLRIDVLKDGPAAIEYFFGPKPGPLPALVLLDLKLPMINGLELLERMRTDERTKSVPVVVLTS